MYTQNTIISSGYESSEDLKQLFKTRYFDGSVLLLWLITQKIQITYKMMFGQIHTLDLFTAHLKPIRDKKLILCRTLAADFNNTV